MRRCGRRSPRARILDPVLLVHQHDSRLCARASASSISANVAMIVLRIESPVSACKAVQARQSNG